MQGKREETRRRAVHDNFASRPSAHWRQHVVGSGALEHSRDGLRLVNNNVAARRYSDAQLDDYQGLPRHSFLWRPPLRLTVRARFSHPAAGRLAPDSPHLRGTAGFGFWNDPFLMTGARLPALPRAIWFFYASPSTNLKLDPHTPGYGWKAAVIDAQRPVAFFLAPFAPLAALLMNCPLLYRCLWPPVQRALRISEAAIETENLAPLTAWHSYVIEWGIERARFLVDAQSVLEDAPAPRGPLGFVMWLDNQYMQVTPWGRLGWGLLDIPERQWLQVDRVTIEPLSNT